MKAAFLNENYVGDDGKAFPRWEQFVPVKEYYTIQDVCTILQVGGPSVYGAIKRGTMRGVKINGVKHVRHTEVVSYLSRRSSAPIFDPSNLVIEEILPDKEAALEAEGMLPTGTDTDFDDFLDA